MAWTEFASSEAETVSFHMSAMGGSTQQWPAVYLRTGSTTCAIVQRYSNGQWRVGNSLVANTAPAADSLLLLLVIFCPRVLVFRLFPNSGAFFPKFRKRNAKKVRHFREVFFRSRGRFVAFPSQSRLVVGHIRKNGQKFSDLNFRKI